MPDSFFGFAFILFRAPHLFWFGPFLLYPSTYCRICMSVIGRFFPESFSCGCDCWIILVCQFQFLVKSSLVNLVRSSFNSFFTSMFHELAELVTYHPIRFNTDPL